MRTEFALTLRARFRHRMRSIQQEREVFMSKLVKLILAAAFVGAAVFGSASTWAADKNWTPPANKIYGQKLSDETMAAHPELLSVTLHGVPPGKTDVYTMFAGSYP